MRLIDEREWEKLYNELTKDLEYYDHYENGFGDAVDRISEWLDVQPTVDAEPVVRCKDCRNYKQNPDNDKSDYYCMCWADWIPTEPEDFCSYGERKEGADNA